MSLDLLEILCGWLLQRDIQAVRAVCSMWKTCRASCPVLLGLPSTPLRDVETLHVQVTDGGAVDVASLRTVRRLYLKVKSQGATLALPRTFDGDIFITSISAALVLNWDCFRGRLVSVEWLVPRNSLVPASALSALFCLPRLLVLVLHEARHVSAGASATCPLERLELVDCVGLDLGFLDSLQSLRSLGFRECKYARTLLPEDVPAMTRVRIEHLTVSRRSLFIPRRGRYEALKLDGYSGLRGLSLESEERNNALSVATDCNVASMFAFEELTLNRVDCSLGRLSCLVALRSVDLDFCNFTPAVVFPVLTDLVLRDVPMDFRDLVKRGFAGLCFVPCLRRLKLTGARHSSSRLVCECVPPLEVLELVGLHLRLVPAVRTLKMDVASFALLSVEEQTAYKKIPNLWVR